MEWTQRYFSAISTHQQDIPLPKVADVVTEYGTSPKNRGGSYYEIKQKVLKGLPEEFFIL